MSDATPTARGPTTSVTSSSSSPRPCPTAWPSWPGGTRYTFRQFDERTNQVARTLLDLGLEPGAKVAMYSWNRAEWVEVFFGAFKARVVPINVNYRYVADELGTSSRTPTARCSSSSAVRPGGRRDPAEAPDAAGHHRHRGRLRRGRRRRAARLRRARRSPRRTGAVGNQRSSDDLYFLYTGGTTGMPKGVMWRHEDIFFAALSSALRRRSPRPEEIKEKGLPEDSPVPQHDRGAR